MDDSEPIEIPITDTLDLHPFRPAEVQDVACEYLLEAWARGLCLRFGKPRSGSAARESGGRAAALHHGPGVIPSEVEGSGRVAGAPPAPPDPSTSLGMTAVTT